MSESPLAPGSAKGCGPYRLRRRTGLLTGRLVGWLTSCLPCWLFACVSLTQSLSFTLSAGTRRQNPKATVQRTNKKVNNDPTLRIQNLSILIKQIKSYYQETLQQLVMMPLPNVLVLGRNPLSEQGLEEMKKLLLLLLGCAVQCEKKEEYIERIQTLDFDTKAAIAAHIQEVTHNQENVVDLQWFESGEVPPEDLDSLSRNLAFHLKHLVDERDAQLESYQLLSDARSARAYRDELDALREKAIRVDKLESELSRYKEKLHDIEFYKARVEELKEDNQVLLETKTMLEEQLDTCRTRSDKLHLLEKENLQLKSKIHDLEMERDMDRKRVEELLEENLVLEMAQKQSMDESLHLGWELEQLSKTPELTEAPQKSLGEEVNELTSSRLLKLEKDNQALLKTVEELRGAASQDTVTKLAKVNQENQKLHQKLKGLEQENKHLGQTVSSLRQRCQVGAEARLKDVEKENRVLHESICETTAKLNKMEFEIKQLRKDLEVMKEKGERAEELEVLMQKLERDNESLQKKVTSLGITCEKMCMQVSSLEKENSELEAEGRRLKKNLDGLKNIAFQLEALEKENAQLEQENLQLRRSAESLRATGAKAAQLEAENRELENEKSQLKRTLELLKASSKKTERLEMSYQGLDTENQRLQKALENSSKKIQQLEAELQEVETENQALQRNLEELKISSKRLEQLEQEELVSEKLRTQQINNDLEKLTHELEKIGLNKERLLHDEGSDDRFKLLETKLESTLKSTLEIKEEKIAALEARLQESSNLNQQLRQELKTVKKNYEALRQREEEEKMVQSSPPRGGEDRPAVSKWEKESHEATRELLKVKDRLIEVERNVSSYYID
ncbi:unnamed protein product [Tetraodon nigroviridis]|uniref:(spotted green pufferfish) hypothetical protein n=1 Tax=Tetraodon nigroviridis TaxID=99883 RepID=Q4SQL9_TETNG|nr:unnamed protein product [Tetraodon nigroviridis]